MTDKNSEHHNELVCENPFAQKAEQTPPVEPVEGEKQPEEAVSSENEPEVIVPEEDDLKTKYDRLNNQYIRLAADFDNYRKRQAQEKEVWLKYGLEQALLRLIEVLDNFDRANASIASMDDVEKIKEVFGILNKQLIDSLEKMGLKTIDTKEKEFNPNLHEAVMQTPNDELAEHTIINELQKGYMLSDKVLRPSLVNVSVKSQ